MSLEFVCLLVISLFPNKERVPMCLSSLSAQISFCMRYIQEIEHRCAHRCLNAVNVYLGIPHISLSSLSPPLVPSLVSRRNVSDFSLPIYLVPQLSLITFAQL